MLQLHKLDANIDFPHPELALPDPNGLLAFGGDLSPARLMSAYCNGIFPWFSEGEPILWWSPDPRGVLPLQDFHCSRSLAKIIRKNTFRATLNYDFNAVIQACATIPRGQNGTWITEAMIEAYQRLHQIGFAHSVEIWLDQTLVGGLYGVLCGKVFCGESMFSKTSDASKVALFYLVKHMRNSGCEFIDCQMQTSHLQNFGCKAIPRREFLAMLNVATRHSNEGTKWQSQNLSD